MTGPGSQNILVDESSKNNNAKATGTSQDPQWRPSNEGLLFSTNSFL